MHKRAGLTVLLLGILAATSALGLRAAPGAAEAEPKGPELAVYNQGLALVKEARTLSLTQGTQPVAISDVPAQIDPTSVYFKSLTDPSSGQIRAELSRWVAPKLHEVRGQLLC
jgi:hypothetical protein